MAETPVVSEPAADPLGLEIAECRAQILGIRRFNDSVDHARLLAMLTHATPRQVSFHRLSVSSLGGESPIDDVEVQLLGQTDEGEQVVNMLKRLDGFRGLSRPQLKDSQRLQDGDSARRFEIRFAVDPQALGAETQLEGGPR